MKIFDWIEGFFFIVGVISLIKWISTGEFGL